MHFIVQRGQFGLLDNSNTMLLTETEARGTFSSGQARGTVVFRFPDRPGCNSLAISWTARAP